MDIFFFGDCVIKDLFCSLLKCIWGRRGYPQQDTISGRRYKLMLAPPPYINCPTLTYLRPLRKPQHNLGPSPAVTSRVSLRTPRGAQKFTAGILHTRCRYPPNMLWCTRNRLRLPIRPAVGTVKDHYGYIPTSLLVPLT